MTDEPAPCCAAGRSGKESGHADRSEPGRGTKSTHDGTDSGVDGGTDRRGNHGTADRHRVGDDTSDPRDVDSAGMVRLGGTFTMGNDDEAVGFPADGEGPTREVTVDPFYVDRHAVTNADFYRFVDDTGYATDAERFGWSYVFEPFLTSEAKRYAGQSPPGTPWWVAVQGATWYRPEGPGSSVADRLDHPVVHVSWRDATAFAAWAGKRLPTEAEWELAARGGLEGARFPWGDELTPDGEHRCNVWQGEFPTHDTGADGYRGTAPVDAFDPNGYGLYNPVGNVWEWCVDWFSPDYHETSDDVNPSGPADGSARSMRGGSYLCHRSYCNRYRVAARSSNTPDSSTGNIGFRCAVDASAVE